MSDLESAQIIIPHIMELIQPRSVLHAGCGRGVWLSVFRECGVEDVWGIDDSSPPSDDLRIDAGRILVSDLEHAFSMNREFDIVICLGRGEHIAQRGAATLVTSLTRLAPVVLFSAAVPYQDGILAPATNEQWPPFWCAHFRERGFEAVDILRARLWCNEYVKWTYAQNALLFIRGQVLTNYPLLLARRDSEASPPHSYIHPKPYLTLIQRFQAEYKRQVDEIQRLQRSCEELAMRCAEIQTLDGSELRREAMVQRLGRIFEETCGKLKIRAKAAPRANRIQFCFESNGAATSQELQGIFDEAVAENGFPAAYWDHLSPDMLEPEIHNREQAIRLACRMVHNRAVDLNSFQTGEIAFQFSRAPMEVVERGLALHRYPSRAAVDHCVDHESVLVHFAAGDLGDITSAGLWIPTWLSGDFELTVRYRLLNWIPPYQSLAIALWVMNRTANYTCYAQRTAWDSRPHAVDGVVNEVCGRSRRPISDSGQFRITRRGRQLVAWHRDTEEWHIMMQRDQPEAELMLAGAKVWGPNACGGLQVVFSELEIDATPAATDDPVPPYQPDPRVHVLTAAF